MIETLDGQNVTAANGFIYVWSPESGIYARCVIDDEMHLSHNGEVSFINFGGNGDVMTAFISPTRAYSMTPCGSLLVPLEI